MLFVGFVLGSARYESKAYDGYRVVFRPNSQRSGEHDAEGQQTGEEKVACEKYEAETAPKSTFSFKANRVGFF